MVQHVMLKCFLLRPVPVPRQTNEVALPPRESIPGESRPIPYILVGDDGVALKDWIMKPFPFRGLSRQQRVFNYRLSRARRVMDNAFGILAKRQVNIDHVLIHYRLNSFDHSSTYFNEIDFLYFKHFFF